MKLREKYWAWRLKTAQRDYGQYLLAEESGYSSPLYKQLLQKKIKKTKAKLAVKEVNR